MLIGRYVITNSFGPGGGRGQRGHAPRAAHSLTIPTLRYMCGVCASHMPEKYSFGFIETSNFGEITGYNKIR